MLDAKPLLILIPALPLAATLLTAALGKRMLGRRSHWPLVLALAGSLLLSLLLLIAVGQQVSQATGGEENAMVEQTVTLWTWADVPGASARCVPRLPR